MPFRIQRFPQGLGQLLSIFGGQTPTELEDRTRAVLDTLQMYGLQQRIIVSGTDAAAVEGGTTGIGPPDNAFLNRWAVLFAASANIVKTGTVTDIRLSIVVARGGGTPITYASSDMGPYGATVAGNAALPFVAPYPMILTPPWSVGAFLGSLGTDATASVTMRAEVGVLG